MSTQPIYDALKRGDSLVFVDGKADTAQRPMVFLDEFGYYLKSLNDDLSEELRGVEGVPNATYLVQGDQVFVFAKLLALVKEKRASHSDKPLADLARGLVASATVSADEAVRSWGVVAHPYEVVTAPSGGVLIRHRPLNARVPDVFKDREAAHDVLVGLLLGAGQAEGGDFIYRGQALTLCDPLDPALLPPRPVFNLDPMGEVGGYMALANMEYQPGFAPVSRAVFDSVRDLGLEWARTGKCAAERLGRRAADLWQMMVSHPTHLQLGDLNDPSAVVPEYGQQEGQELRALYPELSMLSDGALYDWFNLYQSECYFIGGWSPSRDDWFIFYLLGKVASREHAGDAAACVGRWVAHALSQGDAMCKALAFGQAANEYDDELAKLTGRVEQAMYFLAEDQKTAGKRGPAISTFNDIFRSARMSGDDSRAVVAQQSLSDFAEVHAQRGDDSEQP